MKTALKMKYTFSLLSALVLATQTFHAAAPTALKTEFLENPIGIDTVKPRFSWIVADTTPGAKQTAYQVQAASSPRKLAKGEIDLWDSGKVISEQSHLVEYAGKPLVSRQPVWWQVKVWSQDGKEGAWSKASLLELGLLAVTDWGQAKWITTPTWPQEESEVSKNWVQRALITEKFKPEQIENGRIDLSHVGPSSLLRKEFTLPSKVVKARLYISTLGFHELTVNGKTVDDHRLETSPSHPPLFTYYVVKDVTQILKEGANSMGLVLGNGRYVEQGRSYSYGDRGSALVLLVAELTDGSKVEVATDESWRTSRSSILKDSYWVGEAVDARLAQPGWDKPGFNDASWQKVQKTEGELPPKIVFQSFPSERVTRRVKPVKLLNPAPGVWVYDMGEAIVGNAELKVDLPRGTMLGLRYSEDIFGTRPEKYFRLCWSVASEDPATASNSGMISPKIRGSLINTGQIFYKRNLKREMRGWATPADVFCTAGGGPEVFERKFGYRDFRYVELTGYPGTPTLETVTGLLIHNDLASIGTFTSSNALFNEIADAAARTGLYLLHGMQHDNAGAEKEHNTEILAEHVGLYAYRFGAASFISRQLSELRDYCAFQKQGNKGRHIIVPPFNLSKGISGRSDPNGIAFSKQYTGLPWNQYLCNGDRRELELQYPLIRDFVRYFFENPELPGLIRKDVFSDHNANTSANDLPLAMRVNPTIPGEYLGTVTGHKMVGTAISIAEQLGHTEDAERWRKLQNSIRSEVRKQFLDSNTGKYCPEAIGVQGINATAIDYGIAGKEEYQNLADEIVSNMKEKWNGHLSTGNQTSWPLVKVLSQNGHIDEAYAIMNRTTYPSLGHMLSFGSKTIAETWGLPDAPSTAAHIHAELTKMAQWFYETLCGIQPNPAAPGFKHFYLDPHFPKDLKSAGMEFQSSYGRIATSWEQRNGSVTLKAQVPWNTSATVKLPGFTKITLNGKPQENSQFDLPAGEWEIVANQIKEPK
jgi:alpha-L-rhamnosidase